MAKEKKPAVDLQKIINEGKSARIAAYAPCNGRHFLTFRPLYIGRDRKKAQDAAGKVFGKNRVSSAPAKTNGAGSLASRAGVNKVRVTHATPQSRLLAD